ncbi:MAG: helix-turn-helix domain-containing protein [Gemmatimonadaceae bacterium]
MSTQPDNETQFPETFVELTPVGKQLEMLRIERGLSKQHLARYAGTSRQQLWRVMTGKSELTSSLRQRLAEVLHVDAAAIGAALSSPANSLSTSGPLAPVVSNQFDPAAIDFPTFVADTSRLRRTLQLLPSGPTGRRIKRALLDALEDLAVEHAVPLSHDFFELRRDVVNGEL